MNKKILIRKIVMIGMMIGLIFIVTGCSSPIVKEKAVFEDIKKADSYCSTYDFEYDSMEVIKRMTDEEERLDTVYVNFACHNDVFEYTVECAVDYVLYNEGWLFENYNIINSSYTATKNPDTETVLKDFPLLSDVEEWELLEIDEDGQPYEVIVPNQCQFIGHSQKKVSEYFTWDVSHYIKYTFTPEDGWVGEEYHQEQYANWNWDSFLGKWKYSDTYSDLYGKVTIQKIQVNEVMIDYAIKCVTGYESGQGTFEMNYITEFDFPFYEVWISNQNGLKIEKFCITPYGLYEGVYEYDDKTHLGTEYLTEAEYMVEMIDIVGMNVEEAAEELDKLDLDIWVRDIVESTEEYGTILEQEIEKGKKVETGTYIAVVVAGDNSGQKIVQVPNVVALTELDAIKVLEQQNFSYEKKYEASDTVEKGYVISQTPEYGGNAKYGSRVTVVISEGPAMIKVPALSSLKGKTIGKVLEILEESGFKVNVIEEWNSDYEEGVVYEVPDAGKEKAYGSVIDVYVSKG